MAPDPDPMAAVLDQLAASREHLGELDARENAHHAELRGQVTQLAEMVTTMSRALADDTAAMARLDALDQQVNDLIRRLPGANGDTEGEGFRPRPAPAWWKLSPDGRRAPVAELRDWVEQVYRPGYGDLATGLGPCWPEHDLCLYALDIASQLWCALYLQPQRTASLLSAQAEYQARILPAIAAQLARETRNCARHAAAGYPRSTR